MYIVNVCEYRTLPSMDPKQFLGGCREVCSWGAFLHKREFVKRMHSELRWLLSWLLTGGWPSYLPACRSQTNDLKRKVSHVSKLSESMSYFHQGKRHQISTTHVPSHAPFNKRSAVLNAVFICQVRSPVIPPKTNTHTYREFSKYFSCIADVGSCLIKSCLDNSFCYFYQTLRKAHHASLTAQWDRGRGDGAYRVNLSAQQ